MTNIGSAGRTPHPFRILGPVAGIVLAAGNAMGAISSCVSGSGTSLNNYNNAANGCSQTNLIFSNFQVAGTASDAANNGFPTAAQISLSGVSLGTYDASLGTQTGVQIRLTSSEWDVGAWLEDNLDSITSTINFQSALSASAAARLTAITLSNVSVAGFQGSDTATLRLDFCYGATESVAGAFNMTNCTAAGGTSLGYIQYQYNGSTTPAITSSGVSGLGGAITTWATRVSISLNQDFSLLDPEIQITGFTLGYDQVNMTPEPSTFMLISVGLTGLGVLRRRCRGGKDSIT